MVPLNSSRRKASSRCWYRPSLSGGLPVISAAATISKPEDEHLVRQTKDTAKHLTLKDEAT
jgi:hypothetical protein